MVMTEQPYRGVINFNFTEVAKRDLLVSYAGVLSFASVKNREVSASIAVWGADKNRSVSALASTNTDICERVSTASISHPCSRSLVCRRMNWPLSANDA